jgi:hypothetical protein
VNSDFRLAALAYEPIGRGDDAIERRLDRRAVVVGQHRVCGRAEAVAGDEDGNVLEVEAGMLGLAASLARRPGETGSPTLERFQDERLVRLDEADLSMGAQSGPRAIGRRSSGQGGNVLNLSQSSELFWRGLVMRLGAGFTDFADTGPGLVFETVVFLEHFTDLPDPRQLGKVVYPCSEVLLLCLLAVLARAETFVDIARFGEKKLGFLRRFKPFDNGVPLATGPGRSGERFTVRRRSPRIREAAPPRRPARILRAFFQADPNSGTHSA